MIDRYDHRISETDGSLVSAAQAGDRHALDQLLRAQQPRIWTLCRRMAGNDADASDATQEALIAVLRGLPRFDGRSQFSTWVYRVATNACLDEMRRRGRRPVPGLPDGDLSPPLLADPTSGVADRLTLDAALLALPAEYRAAVVLRDVCDLDYAEIAEVLGVPPGTVRSRIARGRMALSRTLGNQIPPTHRPMDAHE